MIRTVKLRDTTYTWVDSVAVEQNLTRPTLRIAARYLVSFVGFCVFVSSLLIVILQDTRVSEANLVHTGITKKLGAYTDVKSTTDLVSYLDSIAPALVVWPTPDNPVAPLPLVLGTHVLVGSLRIVQHRASAVWNCKDSVFGAASVACAADFDAVQSRLERLATAAPFIGPRTLVQFPFVEEALPCPASLPCSSGTTSRIRPDSIFYPDSGYVIEYYAGALWVNTTRIDAVQRTLDDFIDPRTRHVRVTGVLFNPQLNLFTQFNVHFELPVSGGVFPFVHFNFLPLVDRSKQALYTAAEVYLWLYVACSTLAAIAYFGGGCRRKTRCLRCRVKGCPTPVTRCLACGKPLPTQFSHPEECTWCNVTLPAIPHECWRVVVYNPWTVATLAGNLLFLVARIIVMVVRAQAIELVRGAALATAAFTAGDGTFLPREASVLFGPVAQVGAVANDFLAVMLVLEFVRCYRYIGRFSWAAKFLRVFSAGGVLITSFFFTFAIVFVGFGIAFHLLLAEGNDRFASLTSSMRTTFFALIMVIDWEDIESDNSTGWIFALVYVAFTFTTALVMLNVLISLVTYEYKLSVLVVTTDVESLSLRLLVQPALNWWERVRGPATSPVVTPTQPDMQTANFPSTTGAATAEATRDVKGRVADAVEEDDVEIQMVKEALRNVTGLSAVMDAGAVGQLCADAAALRRDLQTATRFVRTCGAVEAPRNRSRSVASLIGYDADMPYVGL
jgi:hypothetical protein